MSADQDESSKSSDEKEAEAGKPKQGEATGPEVSRDSDPPLRGSMADLEQELAQLLDGAPEEDDDDDEDDDVPLVPPHAPGLDQPKLEPFDSDPGGLGGAGYDSWGPKIDLSAEVPSHPSKLDDEVVKAALAAPGAPEPPRTESGSESAVDSGKKSSSARADGAKSGGKSHRDSDDGDESADQQPDSDVPDTKASAQDMKPARKKQKKKRSTAAVKASTPPPSESKGAFTPLRAVLVVLGLLGFIWLIRNSPSRDKEAESTHPPAPATEAPSANDTAPLEASPDDSEPEMAADPPAEATAAAPPTSASALPVPDPSSLAGDGPLPFDRVSVLSALGPFAIEAARCRRKPDPSGRVMVNLVIAPSGSIKAIATGPKHSGTKTEECILAKLRRAKLEPHAGGDETIALPVQLK